MILDDFECGAGHQFELMWQGGASAPSCPECGGASHVLLSATRLAGADPGPDVDHLPQTWRSVANGDRETVDAWRAVARRRARLEARYPDIAPDHRPVLAHEGIFAGRPLRAGDNIAAAVADALDAAANNHIIDASTTAPLEEET